MLVGFIALYFSSGAGTFNMIELAKLNVTFAPAFQALAFGLLFFGFIVKMPVVPFHTWLPDAHVEAPTAGSVLLAGVLLKMGSYGIIRIALPILPDGAREWLPMILVLAILSILYGAVVCLAQRDLKKMVAYSSISHMGIVLLGIATFTDLGINAAVWMMFAHGLITAVLFMACGSIQHAAGTRIIADLGGLAARMPKFAALMLAGWLASLGLPGMVGFVAEFQAFLGFWDRYGLLLILPIASVAVTAGYMIWSAQRTIFGPLTTRIDTSRLHDIPWYEAAPMALLVVLIIVFGIQPSLLAGSLAPSVESVATSIGVS
jgi:proton-translocating NADH-quinone oxidoreductase chain M